MRYLALLAMACLPPLALPTAAQKSVSPSLPPQPDYLPAGPFYFERGAPRPTDMDAFRNRPTVKSPSGRAQITVTGPAESLKAWVTLEFLGRYARGLEYQVWPIERDVDVLWRPDSRAFALTDNRYANMSYVLVCGTNFRLGERGLGLGIPITDLTPVVRKTFGAPAKRYYGSDPYDVDMFYLKALRWVGNDHLLVGLDARTLPANAHGSGRRTPRIREWYLGYLIDVPSKRVVGDLSEAQLLSRYGIRVAK